MNQIEEIALSILAGDALRARSLVQDLIESRPILASISTPGTDDPIVLSLSAALVELLAERLEEPPPSWAAGIGAAPKPTYLLQSALTMPRLREMCEAESPLPLRRRGFFAPADYLVGI